MCVIVVCPKGTSKTSEFLIKALKTSAEANTDGAGYAFKKDADKTVYVSKGYKKYQELIDTVNAHELTDDDELIVHFRIGNKGAKNVDMMHPFVAETEKEGILANHAFVTKPVMFHNGTLTDFCGPINGEFSDTYRFVRYLLSVPEITNLLIRDENEFAETFDFTLKSNRLAFLFPGIDKPIAMLGKFMEEEGYFFSNESYKTKGYKNVGGHETYHSSKYYDSYNDYISGKPYTGRDENAYPSGKPKTYLPVISSTGDGTNCKIRNIHDIKNSGKLKSKVISVNQRFSKDNIIDFQNQITYCRVGGFYVPEIIGSEQDQYDSCKVVVNKYNYTEVMLLSKVSRAADYTKDAMYKIVSYDERYGLHTIGRILRGEVNTAFGMSYVTEDSLYTDFDIRPAVKYEDKYVEYYEYLANNTPTKTSNKKLLSHLITKAGRNKVISGYKGLTDVSRDTLCFIAIQNAMFLCNDDSKEVDSLLLNKCLV